MRVLLIALLLLSACGAAPATCPSNPDAPAVLVAGYTTTSGERQREVNVWSALGQPGAAVVGRVREGETVWVLEQRGGGVHIETAACLRGWVDAQFIRYP